MSKICGYNCEHNKSGVCQITGCSKKSYMSDKTETELFRETWYDINQIRQLQQENKQLKDLIDTILNFSFFKEECPLNFSFEDNSKENKAQDVFYKDEYCENACNDDYRKCWLKYFEKMQELERDGINE